MKKQVNAIFVFIGVVVLSSAFLQGSVTQDTKPSLATNTSSNSAELSKYGTASVILAMRGDETNPFGSGENQNQHPAEENTVIIEVSEVLVPPTICNIYITQPALGELISGGFMISGYVDDVEADCYWAIFEGNAGFVEIYDNNNNLLADYSILGSVGEWMQFPSYFEAFMTFAVVPETEGGYIRFYENTVQDGSIPDVFDFPVNFSFWEPAVEISNNGFLENISNFFTGKEAEEEAERQRIAELNRPPSVSEIFGHSDVQTIPDFVMTESESVPLKDRSSDFCELRDQNKLICFGSYTDDSHEVCGCDTFSGLESFQSQQKLNKFSVDLSGATFEKLLFIGDRGEDVSFLQEALFVLGHYDQIPSGVYDGKTSKAVRDFQKENSLSGWGLIVGDKSNKVLKALFPK
jgi:hypothetical protein